VRIRRKVLSDQLGFLNYLSLASDAGEYLKQAIDEFAMWRMRLYSDWFNMPYRINKSGVAQVKYPK
jgi:hypothetical protein